MTEDQHWTTKLMTHSEERVTLTVHVLAKLTESCSICLDWRRFKTLWQVVLHQTTQDAAWYDVSQWEQEARGFISYLQQTHTVESCCLWSSIRPEEMESRAGFLYERPRFSLFAAGSDADQQTASNWSRAESKCWDIQDFIEDIPGVTILYGLHILYDSVSLSTTHERAVKLSDSLKHFYSREGEWGELLCFCCLLVKKTTLFSLLLLMWFSLHDFCFDHLFPAMKLGKKSTKSWFHQFILISSTLPRSS